MVGLLIGPPDPIGMGLTGELLDAFSYFFFIDYMEFWAILP